MSISDINKVLVKNLADALNDRDFTRARSYLADDLHFVGVIGPPIEGADAYIDAMRRLDAKQHVLKCVAEYDDVACFYELSLPKRPHADLFGCGLFTVHNDKIQSLRIVLDPTPLGKA
jgi:hypothetical protein